MEVASGMGEACSRRPPPAPPPTHLWQLATIGPLVRGQQLAKQVGHAHNVLLEGPLAEGARHVARAVAACRQGGAGWLGP